jgi:DNA sulfur modification protein DndD
MILEQLRLRNFCLFRGKQTIDLSPRERQGRPLPIILFGGLNGGGKTTLLDAIQLALYGSRAKCSKRSGTSYDDFLRHSINHGVGPEEGASIVLSFRYFTEGDEHLYEVCRAWQVIGEQVREELSIFKDGSPDSWLSDHWTQLVEELIPLEVSQLFFFDAEKIRSLAEDESSSKILGTAIKALLGLDIVERLVADATVLQTRLIKESGDKAQKSEIETLQQRLREIETALGAASSERASLQNKLDRAKKELKTAEERFSAGGGKHWEQREQNSLRLAELKQQKETLEKAIRDLAAGDLPLALVPDLMTGLSNQVSLEAGSRDAQRLETLLSARDQELISALKAKGAASKLIGWTEKYLSADRDQRTPNTSVDCYLDLSAGGHALLTQLCSQRLPDAITHSSQLVIQLNQVIGELENVERAVAVTPEDADIRQVVEAFKNAAQKVSTLEGDGKRLDQVVNGKRGERASCEAELHRLLKDKVEAEIAGEDKSRMIRLAGRTRETMQEFLRRSTAQKIDRLSALITESFRYLLRKQTLIERISVDPETFAITLYDDTGRAIGKQRLSEGEKQLFAISVLWGLARASARPLPCIIDTPMARLDAAHRRNLIDRYFPNASHQVIILSTDTEVDRRYYGALQSSVARAFHLNYDEKERMTVAEEGYFWKASEPAEVEVSS